MGAKMEKIKVSVIMPAYNCERFIEQAIQSVLIQKVPLELILIDDASKDNTSNIVQNFLDNPVIFYIKNKKNQGVAAARNQGVKLAKGEYIAFLDADDWWESKKLEKQIDKLEETNCVFCYTARKLYTQDGICKNKVISVKEYLTYKMLVKTNSIACSSVLIKAEIAKKYLMEHDEIHEDYLTWLRILQKYKIACGINEPLLNSRLTENGKSRNKLKSIKMTYGVYRYIGIGKISSFAYVLRHLSYSLLRYL